MHTKLAHVQGEIGRQGKELLGAVMFTCSGRSDRFFGETAFDASAFATRFGAEGAIAAAAYPSAAHAHDGGNGGDGGGPLMSLATAPTAGAPLIGMFAGGEVGPIALADAPPSRSTQVGQAALQGFTAVFGLFTVPRRTLQALDLEHADETEVTSNPFPPSPSPSP